MGADNLRVFEQACWLAGTTLVLMYGIARADGEWSRQRDVSRIELAAAPDFSTWSSTRLRAYRASTAAATGALLGVVAIPAIRLEVPLYADTSELHLNRGAGVIAGTAGPDGTGNLGVAGHRDGFFRALRNVRVGQVVEVRTPAARYRYKISAVSIVPASDARLLAATPQPVVTLVTCYPFYFAGNAPQRFVVRGVLISTQET